MAQSLNFIVLDGIDGSGTTTQCQLLAQALRLRGHRVHETREPSNGAVGKLIRQDLGQTSDNEHPRRRDPYALALLFAADRLDHVQHEIQPRICADEIVLCDRYVISSLIYQSLDCPAEWVQQLNRFALEPCVTWVFDIDADIAFDRVAKRQAASQGNETRERYDKLELQRKLADGYRDYADKYAGPKLERIDATASIEGVHQELLKRCTERGL